MQRGLPRGSFEQNEVDEYHTGRPEEPGGARSNPLEAVGRGVPPKLARVESVVVVTLTLVGGQTTMCGHAPVRGVSRALGAHGDPLGSC